jgi:hypothetical protein
MSLFSDMSKVPSLSDFSGRVPLLFAASKVRLSKPQPEDLYALFNVQVLSTLVMGFIAYRIGLVIYRLYFHPLAHFPGPKFAAATTLYRAYWQVWQDGEHVAQFTRLHEQYGKSIFPRYSFSSKVLMKIRTGCSYRSPHVALPQP